MSDLSPEVDAELDAYVAAITKSQQLMGEGRSDLALTELNRLEAPRTPPGKDFWPVIEMMRHVARAHRHSLASEEEDALAEWRAARNAAPPGPLFDEVRAQADGWILIFERGWENLTKKEYESLSVPTQMFVNAQRAMLPVGPELQAASKAVSLGDEGEFAGHMAVITERVTRASAEFPQVGPVLEATLHLVELTVLTARQQRDFGEFEFRRVYALVPAISAKAEAIATSDAATTPQVLPMSWIADVADAHVSVGRVTERLSKVLQGVFSGVTTAEHLSELSNIEDTIRQTQQVLRDLAAPPLAGPYQETLWPLTERLLKLSERLSVLVRPSKRTVLNIAGLASAISFVSLVGLLLLVGRMTDAQLNTGVVLSLSAFFGLVAGFGYGALRFKGFLGSILRGGDGSDSQESEA